jgi:TPR repeat protein
MAASMSLEQLLALANQGDMEAQVSLGDAAYAANDVSAAADWYRLAAEQGHWRAQFNLGFFHSSGLGVERDEEESIRWYSLACEHGFPDALNNLAALYQPKGRLAEAAELFRRAGELGHAGALSSYAFALDNGLGVPADPAGAIELYHRAVGLGARGAQYNLGVKYATGRGVTKDPQRALNLYLAAAEQGHEDAEKALGDAYGAGEGVTRDDVEAVRWYRRAALRGFAPAQCQLGLHHGLGRGVLHDNLMAFQWFAIAALQGDETAQRNLREVPWVPPSEVYDEIVQALNGDAEAQRTLAFRLFHGDGIQMDREAADLWIRLAAENGDLTAQTTYGVTLRNSKDPIAVKASIGWIRGAAEKGDPRGLYQLGLSELTGNGTPRDTSSGIRHLIEASLSGSDEARRALDELVASSDTSQWNEILEAVRWPKVAFILGPLVDGHLPGLRKLQEAGDFSEQSLWYQYEHQVADLHFPEEGDQPLLNHLFGVKVSLHSKYIGRAHIANEFGAAISMPLCDIRQENGLPVYWAPSEESLGGIASMLAFECARKWVRHAYVQVD